jgi:transcription elongation factor Elf1
MSDLKVEKIIECEHCNTEFTVTHNMSEHHYMVGFCCFCGSELEVEVTLDDFVGLDEEDF